MVFDFFRQISDIRIFALTINAPMYKGENGIDNLNLALQELFNPKKETLKELYFGDITYREKDKVEFSL